jgi:flagellar motor switch protein FliG
MLSLFGLLALAPQAPLRAQTGSRSSLEAKLALEGSLEKRVRLVLSEALGTEDIIVIISAELQEQEKKSAEILPGIPEKDKMGEPSLSSTLTMVKKISASLILDKSVTEEDTQLARKLAAGLLGLPPERQDLVSVEKMNFRKTRPLAFADLFLPPNLWSLVWIVIVTLLALFTVSSFLSPISKSARAFVEAFSTKAAASAGPDRGDYRPEQREKELAARPAEAARTEPSTDGRKAPFWFLNSGSTASLAFILKSRPLEDLTIVLSYAPADVAAKLAEALYPKSVEALAALPKVTLMTETRIRTLESDLMAALDYVVGGEEKAISIFGGLDEAVQEKALSAFGRLDPAMSRKINSSIVKLSDLAGLDTAQAQALARRLPMRVLAAALKGTHHADVFLAKLGGGMQERFRQELDLTRAMPADAYKAERAKVVDALRQMVKEGFITLGAQGAHPAPAGAAKPAAGAKPAPAAGLKPHAAPKPAPQQPAAPAAPAAPPAAAKP